MFPLKGIMPKVSVIIPTYNCAKYLSQAIESVLSQTYDDFEIVIVDDGSTDDTRSLVEGYTNKHPSKISYIYQENRGLACARNTAIRNSRGQYIALLDADDMFLPMRLERGMRTFENNPKIGLVHANLSRMSEDGNVFSTPKRDSRLLTGRIFENIFLRCADISIPTILVKKECFNRVGLFDEHLTRLGCEDREMWLRVAWEYEVQYLDEVLGLYRVRKDSMSRNREKMMEARYYVIDKFFKENRVNSLLKRKALARIHRDEGDAFLNSFLILEARREYLKALSFWPFCFWAWVNLFKILLKLDGRDIKLSKLS